MRGGLQTIFLWLFTGVAALFVVAIGIDWVQGVSTWFWQETTCTVRSSGVTESGHDDGFELLVEYEYRHRGETYRGAEYRHGGSSFSSLAAAHRLAHRFAPKTKHPCWVNDDQPDQAYLVRANLWRGIWILLPLAFVGIGLGLIKLARAMEDPTSPTPGRIVSGLIPLVFAAIGGGGLAFGLGHLRSAKEEAERPHWTAADLSPPAQVAGPLTLEPVWGPLGKLGCATFFALLWNGITSIFVWIVAQSFLAGDPEWFVAVVIAPFVLIGLLLLASIPHSILALVNPRPRLRLSSGSIPVGGSAQIDWSFRGAAGRIRRLRIWLEASERVTTRTESSMSFETRDVEGSRIDVLDYGDDRPLAFGSVTVNIPEETRPTSMGEPAMIWKIKLHASIDRWPDVQEEYEVVIEGTGAR